MPHMMPPHTPSLASFASLTSPTCPYHVYTNTPSQTRSPSWKPARSSA
jgi:hypothetical protein